MLRPAESEPDQPLDDPPATHWTLNVSECDEMKFSDSLPSSVCSLEITLDTYSWQSIEFIWTKRGKGWDLTQSYDKSPHTHRKTQKQGDNTKNATKIVDYTTIADRLRTVSWSNNRHPTDVVKPVYERSTLPLTANSSE